MFYVLQNESTAALRRVPILLTDAATGTTAQTGVAITNIYPSVNINGGAFAGGAGTVAEAGYGQYYYQFDATEVATLGLAGIHVTAVGCRDYDAICQVAAFNVYSASGVGITAGDVWAYDISGVVGAGLAGSQLNLAAAGGGTTTGDIATAVWDYSGLTVAASTKETLENSALNASNADSQTQSTNLRSSVWDFDIDSAGFTTNPPYAAGYLINAGNGATTAGSQVWNYDISAISGAGLAGTQLNIAASAIGITAGDVWSYSTREITGGLANTVTSITNPVEVSTPAMAGIANTVWSTDISTYTTAGTAGTQLNIAASGGAGITVGDVSNAVWNSPVASYGTNGTFGKNILRADSASKVGDVTLYSAGGSNGVDADVHRIANDAAASTALKNILTGIGASMTTNITGNITGNLSGSVGSVTADVNVSTASMSGIANTVWSTNISGYTSPSAGYDLSNASSGAGITAGDVWSYVGGRTITGGIADTVTTVTNGVTVTTNNDKTGYSLSSTQTFDLTGNITGNLSGSVGSVTSDVPVDEAAISADVWSYATREITGGTATTVTNAVLVDTASMSGIANTVWSTDVSGYTSPSAGYDLSNASSGVGISAADVWNYTLTSSGVSADTTLGNADDQATGANTNTNSPTLEANIWGYATRTLTSGSGITAGDVWSYATRTTTGGVVDTNNDKTGYSLSSTQTFNVTGNITGNVSGSVGSVTNAVDITTNAMSGTAGSVWNYVTRTLTSGSGITAGDVWSYGTRTITGGIADTVTTVSNGVTVTTNNDKTGYALSTAGVNAVQSGLSTLTQAQVGTEVDASLSDVGLTSTVTGRIDATISSRLPTSSYVAPPTEAAIASSVWSNASRTITGGAVTSVVDPVNVSTASMSGIAGTVWSYTPRTITSGAGATAGDIWTYNIASITASGTAGAVLNDASVSGSVVTIVNGPYRLTSIAEGTDGRIDILADSVQTIQLNCLDGFGQPFNVTGYAAAVNVYDVSGALAVTYTPTVDFASSGIVSFDIDTDVTGTTGRYTLVVELTAGAEVVQLGPLEILVRPL